MYEGEWKSGKNKEMEFINLQMGMFMKASIKMIKGKEFLNLQIGMFIKASLKIIYSKEKEFINFQMGI